MWISSNAQDDSKWHLAIRLECRGPVTGKVFASYRVPYCTRRQLGGPYGHSSRAELGEWDDRCARCEAMGRKIASAIESFAHGCRK